MGLIVHCSASTSISADPNAKTLVCSVEEAIQRGADAVSIHVNLGADSEQEMLGDFAVISQSCNDYNIPLLAMMYVRGHDVKDTPENIDEWRWLAAHEVEQLFGSHLEILEIRQAAPAPRPCRWYLLRKPG